MSASPDRTCWKPAIRGQFREQITRLTGRTGPRAGPRQSRRPGAFLGWLFKPKRSRASFVVMNLRIAQLVTKALGLTDLRLAELASPWLTLDVRQEVGPSRRRRERCGHCWQYSLAGLGPSSRAGPRCWPRRWPPGAWPGCWPRARRRRSRGPRLRNLASRQGSPRSRLADGGTPVADLAYTGTDGSVYVRDVFRPGQRVTALGGHLTSGPAVALTGMFSHGAAEQVAVFGRGADGTLVVAAPKGPPAAGHPGSRWADG